MTKEAKSGHQWAKDLHAFAKSRDKKLGRGRAPIKPKSAAEAADQKSWYYQYQQIRECKSTASTTPINAFFNAGQPNSLTNRSNRNCKCGWCDGTNEILKRFLPQTTQATAATPNPPYQDPTVSISVPIPQKPTAFKSLADVQGRTKTYHNERTFDLTVFGPTCGKCYKCGSNPSTQCKLNVSLKLIHTDRLPRYVQGVGMRCSNEQCNGTWQSFEKSYVDTLPKHIQMMLNAIIVGRSNGVDMSLVLRLRSGDSAASVERSSRAGLSIWHSQLKSQYDSECKAKRGAGMNVQVEEFPPLDNSWVPKQEMLMRAFIRDFLTSREGLKREMAALKSEHALAIDHQAKVVKRAKGDDAQQSCTICSDLGLVLGYYAVPTEDMHWMDTAMKEIVERHGAVLDPDNTDQVLVRGDLPAAIFVDKDCCNGREGGRDDSNKYFYGMVKLLDGFHLILRIGREINSEHDRKAKFMTQLSQCIYTTCADDLNALHLVRQQSGLTDLNSKQKKYDQRVYVRRVVRKAEEIVSKILLLLKTNIAFDRAARMQFELDGHIIQDISPAHDAYPLITKKVKSCVLQQCTHILNGCVTDTNTMNLCTGTADYRRTGFTLPTYKSLRGSSKVEAVHSVADRGMYTSQNIRQIVFDARMFWKMTNLNRGMLRRLGRSALPDSVSPLEVDGCDIVEKTDLMFGFEYCRHVLEQTSQRIEDAVMAELDADVQIQVDDYEFELDDDIDGLLGDDQTDAAADSQTTNDTPFMTTIPDEVGFDSIAEINDTLDEDLQMTIDTLPSLLDDAIDIDDIYQEGYDLTLSACCESANAMASEAGIDLNTTGVAGEASESFLDVRGVNGRRNVALRRRQNQQTPNATPEFNDTMRDKWLELWSDPSIPQPARGRASYFVWYNQIHKAYSTWRFNEFARAERDGTTPPPLYNVSFTNARMWAHKMKSRSNMAHASGVVNNETAEMSSNLDATLNLVGEDNGEVFDDGIGAAIDSNDLATHVAASSNEPQSIPLPRASDVNFAMNRPDVIDLIARDDELADLLKSKKTKKRSQESVDVSGDAERRMVARKNMEELGIQPDLPSDGVKRCGICGKNQSFSYNGIPHKQLGTTRSAGMPSRFCPFADDVEILKQFLTSKKERLNAQKRKHKKIKWG
eukprot:scaffold248301_cov116-Cyclotella_meneghiniana.AAC.1